MDEAGRGDAPANRTDETQPSPTPELGESDQTDSGDSENDPSDGGEVDDDSEDEDQDESNLARNLLEWVVVLGAAVAVAIILRTFVFQAFFIPSESMEITLFEDDRILVNKVSYRLHDVNRGDVVVFRRPDDQPGDIRDLIKRVIALPGEAVEGRNSSIYINDQLLVEPYLNGDRFGDFGPVTVPEGELFMMGDNRDQSLDSRRFGTIDEDRVIGRAFFLFWPFDRMGML
ncbi:MAG: signal peptidase I [Acidimicrobiia bacterium]|nr:signal peptidase I [Acidimicrobiia bacterium]